MTSYMTSTVGNGAGPANDLGDVSDPVGLRTPSYIAAMQDPLQNDQEMLLTPSKVERPDRAEKIPKEEGNPNFVHPMDWNLWHPARLCSFLSFHWITKYLSIGARRQLNEDDVIPLWAQDRTEVLADQLAKHWAVELARPNPSLLRAFWHSFGVKLMLITLFLLSEAAIQVRRENERGVGLGVGQRSRILDGWLRDFLSEVGLGFPAC